MDTFSSAKSRLFALTTQKINILVVLFTFAYYCIANAADIDLNKFNTIENVLVNYLCIFSIVFVFRNIIVEKRRIENLTMKKYSDSKEIIDSIKTACEGNVLLNPKAVLKVIKALNSMNNKKDFQVENVKEESLLHLLTQREMEVTEHIIKGKSNKAISEAMFVTEGTIKNYVSRILEKLELKSRAELMLYLQKRN